MGREGVEQSELNALSQMIIGAAMAVQSALGPGLLESAYEACLAYELAERDLKVEQQKPLPLNYRGVHLECGYRLDLLVENEVIVEVKAVQSLEPIHRAQLLSYLKFAHKPVGLLINYHVPQLRSGIQRVIHTM